MLILIDHLEGATPHTSAQLIRQILNELALARVAARPLPSTSTAGEKGSAHSLTELILTGGLSASAVTAAATVIVGFVQRGAVRRLMMRCGDREIDVTGISRKDARAAVESFMQLCENGTAAAALQSSNTPTDAAGTT
ncbi:hypothetical protein ACWIF8_00415 [Micromonospora chalcea]